MILTCPQCSTRYHVDATALGAAGRTVRCANCGQRWSVSPPADTPQIVEFSTPAPATVPRMRPVAAGEQVQNRRSISLVGWLVAVLAVLVVASVVIGRNEIVAGFPASASIYQKLGLIPVEHGLQFEAITSTRLQEGGIAVLVVEGGIVNVTPDDREVPPIRITLLDSGGRQLQEELFRAKEQHLQPGARTSFSGRVVNPADRARNFSITFEVDS
jgi:predicted Zn finger-like uncharacterized protein